MDETFSHNGSATLMESGEEPVSEDAVLSPFRGLTETAGHADTTTTANLELESPFGSGFATPVEVEFDAFAELVGELEDEDFVDSVAGLVDAAAAAQLTQHASWSNPGMADGLAEAELQAWTEPLAEQGEQLLEEMAQELERTDLLATPDRDLEALLEAMAPGAGSGMEPAFEEFLGGLVRKAKKVARGAVAIAKKGIAAVSKVLPVGILLRKLKAMVRPLLRRVLQTAIGRLPAAVQPIARLLATKYGASNERDGAQSEDPDGLVRDFDAQLAALMLAPDEAEADQLAAEFEAASPDGEDPNAALDSARERLGHRLTELPPGATPLAEIEQFVPVVMAALPAIKLGIGVIGRDRVVRFLAGRIARLISGHVGADAARRIARPIVDVGMRMVGLEVAPGSEVDVAGEALAGAVEETVRRVLDLPAEALADELQFDTAVQQAFAEAAAALLPDELLRPDLPERETSGEGGTWVLMPRNTRPRYRFRKYTRVYTVPISRQTARAVPCSDGGTLEERLADQGVRQWPATAEVHLYETLPGGQLGHLRLDEGLGAADPGEAEWEPEELTSQVAGLLLGEPGLGRTARRGPSARLPGRPVAGAGRRFYRIRVRNAAARGRVATPRRRVRVRLDLASPAPRLRVELRLSERQGQELLARLTRSGRPDLPGALQMLQQIYRYPLRHVLTRRMLARGVAKDAAAAAGIAEKVAVAVTAALSEHLQQQAGPLGHAVGAPAQGLTLAVTFTGLNRSDLAADLSRRAVAATPGWRSGG